MTLFLKVQMEFSAKVSISMRNRFFHRINLFNSRVTTFSSDNDQTLSKQDYIAEIGGVFEFSKTYSFKKIKKPPNDHVARIMILDTIDQDHQNFWLSKNDIKMKLEASHSIRVTYGRLEIAIDNTSSIPIIMDIYRCNRKTRNPVQLLTKSVAENDFSPINNDSFNDVFNVLDLVSQTHYCAPSDSLSFHIKHERKDMLSPNIDDYEYIPSYFIICRNWLPKSDIVVRVSNTIHYERISMN